MDAEELLADCCDVTNELDFMSDGQGFRAGAKLAMMLAPLYGVTRDGVAAEVDRVLADYKAQQDAIPPRDPTQPMFARVSRPTG